MKAEKGDLIRYIGGSQPIHRNTVSLGGVYEVSNEYDEGIGVSIRNGTETYLLYDDEYVIHRKAGEESACSNCGKQGVHTCRGAEYYAEQSEQDAVNHPNHYTQGKFETIEIIEHLTSKYDDGFTAHCVGTAFKYMDRAPYKHESPTECLRKAAKYLEFAIERLDAKSTQ